jgi:hypothetical protein
VLKGWGGGGDVVVCVCVCVLWKKGGLFVSFHVHARASKEHNTTQHNSTPKTRH